MDISVVSGMEILPYLTFVGLALLVAEFLLPTKGILGVIGAGLFALGTISLTTHSDPDIRISIAACALLNLTVLGSAAVIFYMTYRDYNARNADDFSLEGKIAQIVDWNGDAGRVALDGTLWNAQAKDATSFAAGQKVRIVSQSNLVLIIEPAGSPS